MRIGPTFKGRYWTVSCTRTGYSFGGIAYTLQGALRSFAAVAKEPQ